MIVIIKMSDNIEFEIKPSEIDETKFKTQCDFYLNKLEEFKKTEKKMKQYEANIKQYMINNGVREYSNETGSFTIVSKKVSVLDRSLIEDIEQYYVEMKRKIMYKSVH